MARKPLYTRWAGDRPPGVSTREFWQWLDSISPAERKWINDAKNGTELEERRQRVWLKREREGKNGTA